MQHHNTILFLHGLESAPGGTKPSFLAECGYKVLNPALPKRSFWESVQLVQEIVDREKPSVIVGSSRGAAVALCVHTEAKLVLIAPAWKRYARTSSRRTPSSAVIIHSKNDKIISFKDSESLAASSGATLIAAGASHRMGDQKALVAIAAAVKEANNENR